MRLLVNVVFSSDSEAFSRISKCNYTWRRRTSLGRGSVAVHSSLILKEGRLAQGQASSAASFSRRVPLSLLPTPAPHPVPSPLSTCLLSAAAHEERAQRGGRGCSSLTQQKREVTVSAATGEKYIACSLDNTGDSFLFYRKSLSFLQKVARFVASRFCEKKSLSWQHRPHTLARRTHQHTSINIRPLT